MQTIVQALVQWGAAHLAMGPPSRSELAVALALTLLAFVFVVLLAVRDDLFTPLGVVGVFAFMTAALIVHTQALRWAHHQVLQRLQR